MSAMMDTVGRAVGCFPVCKIWCLLDVNVIVRDALCTMN
jgi:hypothetical protein